MKLIWLVIPNLWITKNRKVSGSSRPLPIYCRAPAIKPMPKSYRVHLAVVFRISQNNGRPILLWSARMAVACSRVLFLAALH